MHLSYYLIWQDNVYFNADKGVREAFKESFSFSDNYDKIINCAENKMQKTTLWRNI